MSEATAGCTHIHANDNILENVRNGTHLPPWDIMRPDGSREQAHEVEILGPSRLVYHPHDPMPGTGWRAWIETDSEVVGIVKEMPG